MAAQLDNTQARQDGRLGQFVANYHSLPGIYDEMLDESGQVRPHWQPFLSMLASLGAEEINRRFAVADRYLHDSGVFYRIYEDPAGVERPWPLSHIPLLIEPTEWKQLEAGLCQRAALLEAILADAYGPGQLVRDGRLPAAVIAGNSEFLRPLVGVPPPGGTHLRFYAVDVGRGPDGRWWVLSDRAQAPSGAGYAIENRLALARAMPDIYRTTRVQRIAPFFQTFQAEMFSFSRLDRSRVCLLTPGPLNETYFEHAYLARYLGLLLVEGEDLTANDDGIFIRTIAGPQRAAVLLRRLDADFADPLELNASSRLGVPGLVQAVRDGRVVIVNALGAGLIEARAMLAFLPALATAVLGTKLAVPNVATWWLGHAGVRDEMLGCLDDMVVAPALTDSLAHLSLGDGMLGSKLEEPLRKKLLQDIQYRAADFVVQEAVTLSTMPVWRNGVLQPHPFTLRLFLSKVGGNWKVMPGGFVRIAEHADARAVSLQTGSSTTDAWVLAEGPVAETTLLPRPELMTIQRTTGLLPSRAADNLFWVGRYVERLEATLRAVRALLFRMADDENAVASVIGGITSLLGAWNAAPTDHQISPTSVARAVFTQAEWHGSLPALVGAARTSASVIRDRFSPDAWRALNDLAAIINAPLVIGAAEGALIERVDAALRIMSSFSGLAQENMTQLAGWRFLELGRRIERAILTCRFVRQFAGQRSAGGLDLLLELTDSQITYRQRYLMVAALAPVIDLIMLSSNNPRSVGYQLDRIETHLAALPKPNADGRLSQVQRVATSIATRLRTADAARLDVPAILNIEETLMQLSEMIASSYLTTQEQFGTVVEALA